MLLTGTFAWSSISQRATNPLAGVFEQPDPTEVIGGRIHDHFDGENKDVFAENFSTDEPLLVRIRLLEFMEIDGVSVVTGAQRDDFATWTPHIPYETVDNNQSGIREFVDWTMGGSTNFMPTFNQRTTGDRALETDTSGIAVDFVANGQTAGHYRYLPATPAGQSNFNDGSANFWNVGDEARGYLYTDENEGNEPNIGHIARATQTPQAGIPNGGVIMMADWLNPANAFYRTTGNFWVIDTDGWAYWATLLPAGAATSLLLDAISMNEPDEADWFYAIHVIGQFASVDSLDDWDDVSGIDGPTPSDDAWELLNLINAPPPPPPVGYIFTGGDYEWIIISNTMGAGGHGTGTDLLVTTVQSLWFGARWNQLPNSTAGGYYASYVRNAFLNDFFADQEWAHGIAVQPGSLGGTGFGQAAEERSSLNWDVPGEFTTSTGQLATANNIGGNGAFLLSRTDAKNAAFFANDAGRQITYMGGDAAHWWLRTPRTATSAWSVNFMGTVTSSQAGGGAINSVRPFMILTELP